MSHIRRWLINISRHIDNFIDDLRFRLKTKLKIGLEDPVTIDTYRGYATTDRVFLKGRVLKDRFIISRKGDGRWRNFVNTYKRFASSEVRNARIVATIGENHLETITDDEGYYEIARELPSPIDPGKNSIYPVEISVRELPWGSIDLHREGEVIIPSRKASVGIISDIDDTVLHTGVVYPLKLKVLYYTLFKNARSRKAIYEAADFFQLLSGPQLANPVFYVSNSPWNLYDLLDEFLGLNGFPRGAILLRDFGIPRDRRANDFSGHKHRSIGQILNGFPKLRFVLIGDSGEKDALIYLSIAKKFPDRIAAIYIREVNSPRKNRRIRRLLEKSGLENAILIPNYQEATRHARKLGLIK